MREINGQLRGLLKKPNQPGPVRKNRVVFDETRNEFFDADYIILIREDCAYDEEDEETCTCGEHELVRLCCEEGCQCNYSATNEDSPTQSQKYAPPIEFVDEAALSPPDGYKDNGLKSSLGGALSSHIFGAQHIQQLQVIQRLQQQRAVMLAARNNNKILSPPSTASEHNPNSDNKTLSTNVAMGAIQKPQQLSPEADTQGVCTECAECAECAAKQLRNTECNSTRCNEEITSINVPTVALLPLHTSSPERRITIKEIIAGEERPKYVLQTESKPSSVTERRILKEAMENVAANDADDTTANDLIPTSLSAKLEAANANNNSYDDQKPPPIPPKEPSPTQISGILKGGKLWKNESMSQSDDQNNTISEDDISTAKRSVRFVSEVSNNIDADFMKQQMSSEADDSENQINELIPIKKHSTLFNNSLRPNSAVRQLFPSVTHCSPVLTSETLRAFEESKRAGCLVPNLPSSGDTDTLKRSIERNMIRRSLIKKKTTKSDLSLEERIKQLTCDIDEDNEEIAEENEDEEKVIAVKNSEVTQHDCLVGDGNQLKILNGDKSFSPCSSVSSSSSGSFAYKKISDIFNREKKQEKILEMEENPIAIVPQECRCPAAPDLGMGTQVPVVHTQIHRTPLRQAEPKRQFLSTLAPLTACVAGNKDDLTSYYALASVHQSSHSTNHAHSIEYSSGLTDEQSGITLNGEDQRKVAPDVIAGTPGQEKNDELTAFAYQEANRTDKIKKRFTNDNLNVSSDDDEQNDYGFNKRPSVRGITPKFNSTNEILQQLQEQLAQQMPGVNKQTNNQTAKIFNLPNQTYNRSETKQPSQNASPQNAQYITSAVSHQQHQEQQQQEKISHSQQIKMQTNTITQQQAEQRMWSFYAEPNDTPQRIPIETGLQQSYYQTLPASTMFRQTMIQHGQDESLMYSQNCQTMTSIQPPHYGHYIRSPTRRPESPPPLRNYHQTMVLIPYNTESYSQFASKNIDPKVAHIQRQNILEYQQVTQQTIRVPIGYALPGMQLHVVAGGRHSTHYTAHTESQHPHQSIIAQRYQFEQEGNMHSFSQRGMPEGAAVISHSDCHNMCSPTTEQQNQHPQFEQQQTPNCNQTKTGTVQATQGSVYYSMNV